MSRVRLALAVLVAALAVTAFASAAAAPPPKLVGTVGAGYTTLVGTVGPGFTINLTDESGNRVTHLDPGTYTITVNDKSNLHNFDLRGPGVSQSTASSTNPSAVERLCLPLGLTCVVTVRPRQWATYRKLSICASRLN